MKKTLKILMLSIILIFILGITQVKAARASISASKTTATVGDNVTITVTINAAAWNVRVSGSGISDVIAGYDEDAANTTKTKSYKLNTSVAGTYTVQISGDVTDANDSKAYPSQSVTITVNNPAPKPPVEEPKPPVNNGGTTTNTRPNNNTSKPNNNTTTPAKSSNSKLGSLQIAEGVLTPEFSSGVKEYAITVPNEIAKLNISAIPDSSKATVKIYGNDELQVGVTPMEIVVTAEDGSTTTYKLSVTRAEQELSLQNIALYYINENGERVNIELNPKFEFNVYEYLLEKLPYTVKEIKVEAASNRENAKINVVGNTELNAGKNEITIEVTSLNTAGLEEKKTYKINVEREEDPAPETPLAGITKIGNWFKGLGATIGNWATNNFNKIISAMLLIATSALVGLTIYFAYDYKNYQSLIAKLASYNKENLMERASVALNPEMADNIETIKEDNEIENKEIIEEVHEEPIEEKSKVKAGKGKRFKQD